MGHESLRVILNGYKLEEVKEFLYLASFLSVDVEMKLELSHRLS